MLRVLIFFTSFLGVNCLFGIVYESPKPNVPVDNMGISSQPFLPKVNPISGEYLEEEIDLTIPGCCPLSLTRFYHHFACPTILYALWQFNPETYVKANFEKNGIPFNVLIGERDGRFVLLDGREEREHRYVYNPIEHKSFVNTGSGFPSGQTNPKNTVIKYNKRLDPKDHARFAFYGEITDGSGRRCEYESVMHRWHKKAETEKKTFGPEWWTPYYLQLTKERLPNGNIIRYYYTKYLDHSVHPQDFRILLIEAYNANETKRLGHLKFSYPEKKDNCTTDITVTASDGRIAHYKIDFASTDFLYSDPISMRTGKRELYTFQKGLLFLKTAETPTSPSVEYEYDKQARIKEVKRPGGRIFKTEYYDDGRVKAQSATVEKDKFLPIIRLEYKDQATDVYDGEENRTCFRYDEHRRVVAIEKYQKNQLYSLQKMKWGKDNQLEEESLNDAAGREFKKTLYKYDSFGNVIEETVSGIGSHGYSIFRTYSKDGFNLKLTEDDGDLLTTYTYSPNTNLCEEEAMYEKGILKRRITRKFNDSGICIFEREDDGGLGKHVRIKKVIPYEGKFCQILDPEPLDCGRATEEDIRKMQKGPLNEKLKEKIAFSCVGLPRIIEEWTEDENGKGVFLGRVFYLYTKFGKVEKERHYDSQNILRYTIENTYDERERLATHKNALGHVVSYTYDLNNNIETEKGPRSDMFKKITYDLMNRPILIEEKQSDGTKLEVKKEYDNCGHLRALTDASGFKTTYEYDSLGRQIKIIHPDGAIERREYDILGNVTKEIDPLGNVKEINYNFRNQPISIFHPDGSSEMFFYNPNGTLRTHMDRNGATILYEYDGFKRPLHTKVYGSTGKLLKETSATYSSYELETTTDGEGYVTRFFYDKAGRKIGEEIGKKRIDYFYDSLGRLAKKIVGETVYIEELDFLDRIVEKRVEDRRGRILRKESYDYDEAGNKKEIKRANGTILIKSNAQGLPETIENGKGEKTTFRYQYKGGFKSWEYGPTRVAKIISYDERGREKEIVVENGLDTLQKKVKKYDFSGNLVLEEHAVYDGKRRIRNYKNEWIYEKGLLKALIEGGEKKTVYTYLKGRLHTIQRPSSAVLYHEYDDFGKLRHFYSSDFDYTYIYDRNGLVKKVEDKISGLTTTRAYDEQGNMIEEVLGSGLRVINRFNEVGFRKEL